MKHRSIYMYSVHFSITIHQSHMNRRVSILRCRLVDYQVFMYELLTY